MLDAPLHDDDIVVPGFVDVDDVPEELLDEPPGEGEEGDDSLLKDHAETGIPDQRHLTSALPHPSRARIVPLRRTLKQGMVGPDVIGTKRALNHAGMLAHPKKWSKLAGPFWKRAVKKYQAANGLTPDGVYGTETHRKLVKGGHFDKYGALLMAQAPRATSGQAARDKLEAIALYGYHNRVRIYYTQGPDRMTVVRNKVKFPWFSFVTRLGEDCSSYSTAVYYSGGQPDPNHLGYAGYGFTGTLASHGKQTVKVQRGDLAFYGPAPYRHVTMHVGHGERCVSHGSSSGPLLVSTFRYRGDYSHSRTYL